MNCSQLGSCFLSLAFVLSVVPAQAAEPLRFSEHLIQDKYGYAFGVQAADLDGDGDLDLTSGDVRGKPSLSKLYWFENNGKGLFERHLVSEKNPGWFERHVVGDISGDGRPDIAIVNNRDGHLLWFANNKTPATGPWKKYLITTNCHRAYDIVLLDIDGDGDLDAAAAGYASNLITWFENPGPKGWDKEWERQVIGEKMSEARVVCVGDFNLDGRPDLLAASVGAENVPADKTAFRDHGSRLVWYENIKGKTKAPWPMHVIDDRSRAQVHGHPVDLDGDGDLDVVIAQGMRDKLIARSRHGIAWYENLGSPGKGIRWQQHRVAALPYAFEAVAGDLDGDGDVDIAATAWALGDRVAWYENSGDPRKSWTAHTLKTDWGAANQLIIADLNGDGRPDIAATSDDGSRYTTGALELRWWKNLGHEKRVPRTVFNDDAQVLREATSDDPAPFIRGWLDRESAAVPFSTFVFLAAMPDVCYYNTRVGERYGSRPGTRADALYVHALKALAARGTDPLKLVTSHMQARGKEVMAAIRMSDTHHTSLDPANPLCPQFAIDHPEFVIKQPDGRTNETALDYSFPEVRAHRLAIMKEIVERYEVDGLELNFVRWAKHFPRDKGREKAPIMTEFMGRVRLMMDVAGKTRKRSRRLTLGVRIPESLHTCWLAGVDIETWVKRGWIDYVVISTWNNTDPQLPVEEFARFTRPAGVDTIVVMGNMIGSISTGLPKILDRGVAMSPKHADSYLGMLLNTADARGAAANFYAWGADSISFWNVGIHFGRARTATPQQRKRIADWTRAVANPRVALAGPRTYRFLPMGKGISSRKPPVRNYPWYDEGRSPLGQKNSPVLTFSPQRQGKRLVFPFRMADGRHGESLTGSMTFWVYHATAEDSLTVDLNGQKIAGDRIRRSPAGKRRGGLPGIRCEISLADCPRFRGDNRLGLILKTAGTRKPVPYMEELEVTVTGSTPRKKATSSANQRKIYIAVDSEGPTGVAEYWARNLKPDSPRLPRFRQLLTDDVNAAVRGCFEAGATEVVVKDDGFRDRNVIRNRLDPRARLIASGGPLLAGLDETFAGVMLVGFHAREGATGSVLAHTWSSARRRRYWFNGRAAGELAAYAIVAGHDHQVPIIMATGCDGLCREATDWLGPGVVTVSVKRLKSDGSIELDSPAITRPRISAGARRAVGRIGQARPLAIPFPLHVKLQLADGPTTDGYVRWRLDNKPDWPANRTGRRVLEAMLRSTRHLGL